MADIVDLFVLLVAPGGGDELQGIKRGIMELADLVVVNKADGDLAAAAGRTVGRLRQRPAPAAPQVDGVVGHGHDVLGARAARASPRCGRRSRRFRAAVSASGELDEHRPRQAVAWMWSEVQDTLVDRLRADPAVVTLVDGLEAEVAAGEVSPTTAARQLLDAFTG